MWPIHSYKIYDTDGPRMVFDREQEVPCRMPFFAVWESACGAAEYFVHQGNGGKIAN